MWRSIPIGSATGCGSAAFAILLLATPATPQAITGRAVDANTGTPVEGVAIALLDSLGTTRGSVLSDSAGEFSIAVPAPGAYALWVNRIGYQTVQTRPIDIWGAETVEVEILLDVRAVELDPLTVVGRRRENLRQRDLREYRERVEYYGEPHLGSIKLFTRDRLCSADPAATAFPGCTSTVG
jgi:hypothetical protein